MAEFDIDIVVKDATKLNEQLERYENALKNVCVSLQYVNETWNELHPDLRDMLTRKLGGG